MILSNQLQQQISAKVNTVFTAYGLDELEESMAQCNSLKSMKCSCTDYLCCLPAPPMTEAKVDTTSHNIHSVPHSSNSLVSNYRLFRRPPSAPKITPLTQC